MKTSVLSTVNRFSNTYPNLHQSCYQSPNCSISPGWNSTPKPYKLTGCAMYVIGQSSSFF